MKKTIFFLSCILFLSTNIYAISYTITTNTKTYTLDLQSTDNVLTFKYNNISSEYELWIYDKVNNFLLAKYDINNIPAGTLITNPYTNYKYLILYDNIHFKNIIKKIN